MNMPLFPTLHQMMPQIDFEEVMDYLRNTTERRTWPLWQDDDCLAFIARGREYRSEFHLNPTFEMQYSLKGDLHLHWRTPEGKVNISHVPEGSCLYQKPMVPHSPRFGPDAFQLVIERKRRPGEVDRFHWYCPQCDNFLHEEQFVVHDYGADPVSRAYDRFWTNMDARTCKKCGTVMPDK
ncbi:3-hydroxyanthranilate 3,4-dioxygenase [Hydrogenophaga sp.]|jgi:3-hydroxyanthranilate 3,4-dioxygenase|uniref:3-hydroxyanthranilate 3,4-dioxygenase n=1 Tax=Hydrogenophaga sp. TaxID=1904254 RepID=UPI003F6E81F0